MTEADVERIRWMEQNILPHEPLIRHWLACHRVPGLETDDVVQEMYAKIGSVEAFTSIYNPKGYALQVARSILLQHIRRPQIVSNSASGNLEDLGAASPDPDPEQQMEAKDELREVAHIIATLPRRTRDVLLLRRVNGLSQQETARQLSIAEKTVEKHMTYALQQLMSAVGRRGKITSRASSVMYVDRKADNDENNS